MARVLWERSVERRRLPDGDAPRGWEVESALIRPGAPLDVVPRTSHSDENSRMPTLTTSFYQEALEFQDCRYEEEVGRAGAGVVRISGSGGGLAYICRGGQRSKGFPGMVPCCCPSLTRKT